MSVIRCSTAVPPWQPRSPRRGGWVQASRRSARFSGRRHQLVRRRCFRHPSSVLDAVSRTPQSSREHEGNDAILTPQTRVTACFRALVCAPLLWSTLSLSRAFPAALKITGLAPRRPEDLGRISNPGRPSARKEKARGVVAALSLKPGMSVADVGSGSGFFTRRFVEAVTESGTGTGRYEPRCCSTRRERRAMPCPIPPNSFLRRRTIRVTRASSM